MDSRLIDIFVQLASINALSQNEKPVADYIRAFLNAGPFSITEDDSKYISGSNTGNLICRLGDGGDFVMLAHMDTARPTENMKPVFVQDKITSAGNTVLGVDNRLGVAVLLYTMERIIKEKIPTKNFTVAFTTCEETSLLGSKSLKLDGKIKHGFVFDSSLRPGNFINSSCGSVGFKIFVTGRASHSGISPEKGINSIAVAAEAVRKIRQGRIEKKTTVNIGKIKGGSAVNVVPEETYIEGEVRSFDTDKVTELVDKIHKIFLNSAAKVNAGVRFDSEWDFRPYKVNKRDDTYKRIACVLKKLDLKPESKVSLGGSDANSLNEIGIPSVNIGIGAQNPHSDDEFVLLGDMKKSTEIAMELIRK